MHDHVTKNSLIRNSQLQCWCHVIQLRDGIGRQVTIVQGGCVGRFDESSGGELANGDMIWMPIPTVWTEGNDNIGFHTTHTPHDLRNHLGWMGLIQVAIKVIQELDAMDTKRSGCGE